MVEKIIKFVIILIFAALGVFLMEIATPLLGEFVSSDTLKLGFLGVTPLNLIMGIIGALIFGYIGKAAATPLIITPSIIPKSWLPIWLICPPGTSLFCPSE